MPTTYIRGKTQYPPRPEPLQKIEKKKKRTKSSNGAGGVRLRKDGTFEARVVTGYDDNGKIKRISIYGKTEREVRLKLNKAILDLSEGTYCEKTGLTLVQWLTNWLETYSKQNIKPSTYNNYERYITGHIAPYFGKMKLQDVKTDQLQRFLNNKLTVGRLDGKTGGNSAKTVLNIRNMLHAAYQQAYFNGLIPKNAMELVKAPKQIKKEMRVLTVDEERHLLANAKIDRYGAPIVLALYTGMRLGEVLGLTLEDVELSSEYPCVYVRSSLKREYQYDTGFIRWHRTLMFTMVFYLQIQQGFPLTSARIKTILTEFSKPLGFKRPRP